MSAMMFADSMLGANAEMISPRPSEANTKNAADTARNPMLPRSGMRKKPSPTSAITIMSTNASSVHGSSFASISSGSRSGLTIICS